MTRREQAPKCKACDASAKFRGDKPGDNWGGYELYYEYCGGARCERKGKFPKKTKR